TKFVIVKQTK
ncbi:peroxidase family protein, partial [Vibrio parahaemolyticus VPTS-2010_2]